MHPLFTLGDEALVDLGQNTIENGRVYAMLFDGNITVRRLSRTKGKIIAYADNQIDQRFKFDQEYNENDSIMIIGLVVARVGIGGL